VLSSRPPVPSGRLLALVLLFFCSGTSGLIYQVLWLRQLSLVFGVTVYAASTVLAVFMAGLAIGSLLAGRVASRVRRPLAAFGVAEILIGLLALATPAGLRATAVIYDAVHAALPDALPLVTAARFLCAVPVLLGPTILMGLTLPLLGASSIVRGDGVGARLSALYAANTAGALTGSLLAGYELIGALGMQRTYLAAAAINVLVGVASLWLARTDERVDARTEAAVAVTTSPDTRRAIATIIAISGAASLALEIVWFRVLLQILTATTYAFTTMLATVLGGIALGGVISVQILSKPRDWHRILINVLFATGITIVGSLTFLIATFNAGWRTSAMIQACAAAILPAATLMGITFPIALRLGAFSDALETRTAGSVADRVGRLYALNVAGAILGAIAGGFFLLPFIGSKWSLLVLASLFIVSGALLLRTYPRRRLFAARASLFVAAFGLAVWFLPDPLSATVQRRHGTGHTEVWRHEGAQAAVTVLSDGTTKTMFIDGMHQAEDSAGMVQLHRLIGHLPMVLHPAPSRILVVGLGGGTTPGAISLHPGAYLDIVELSQSVRLAASEFAHVNYDILRRPNVRMRVDDGRDFLRLTPERYDVITADVIQPTSAGAGSLYSREYFTLVRGALRPDGLAMQWIGNRPHEHYRILMRTFLEVFPHTTLWHGGNLMIGSLSPLQVSQRAVEAHFLSPRVQEALAAVGVPTAESVRSLYTAGPDALRAFVGPGDILTDDRPLLEYHRSFHGGAPNPDLSSLRGSPDEVFR
jgi:spermidine synthase